jgi:hypothetical protein
MCEVVMPICVQSVRQCQVHWPEIGIGIGIVVVAYIIRSAVHATRRQCERLGSMVTSIQATQQAEEAYLGGDP